MGARRSDPARVGHPGAAARDDGSGKTSVGEEIAARTGWTYRDNDSLVAELAGVPTADLLERDGVDALRDAESAALRRAVDDPGPLVAGVAEGVVETAATSSCCDVPMPWSSTCTRPSTCSWSGSATAAGGRSCSPTRRRAAAALRGARPVYREVADLVVDTSQGTPADHATQVLAALHA